MITFDVLTLKAFVTEQSNFITGARINKIQQPTRREFIFTLRNSGESKQLYININPQYYHICFMNPDNAQKRVIHIPQKPPMFCMLLRKYLENSRIAKINQVENERILELYIESYNELGEAVFLCLAVEFMGKHSNVILYNTDTGVIIGCAHNVGSEKSREREIYGGIPYIYPPKQLKADILAYNGELNYDTLAQDFYMFSNNFAKLVRGKTLNDLKSYIRLENTAPAIDTDYNSYSLFENLICQPKKICHTVNDMIDDYYAYHIHSYKFNELKSKCKTLVIHKLKKVEKSLQQMYKTMNSGTAVDKYRLWGDLLMANLYSLKDFSDSAKVYDYENNTDITVALDNTISIKDNATRFYKLYNKSKTAVQRLTELISANNIQKEYLEQVLYSIECAETIEDLFEISIELGEVQQINNKGRNKKGIDIKTIELENETRIYIGKNNKQNDYIISKLATDDDLWFHVHNCAGSHVLLKTQNLTDDLILYCSKLAKKNSSASISSKVGVIYTKRKYLRKPPGANLGYVTYKNEKEIIID